MLLSWPAPSTLHVILVDAAKQEAHVVASLAVVQELPEHLDPGDDRLLVGPKADKCHFLAHLDLATLDSSGGYSATASDREHVLHWHQEGLIRLALGLRDIGIQRIHQLADLLTVLTVGVTGLKSLECRAFDDRRVVAREVVARKQLLTSSSTSSSSSASSTMSTLFMKTTM